MQNAQEERPFEAYHLENDFLKLTVLPEAGGRVHRLTDKQTGRALVEDRLEETGLLDPVPVSLEEQSAGSRTLWVRRVEARTGVVTLRGYCMREGRAYLELKIRIENDSPLVQPYAYWLPFEASEMIQVEGGRRSREPLQPWEVRMFSVYFYANRLPVEADAATVDAACAARSGGGIEYFTTAHFPGAKAILTTEDGEGQSLGVDVSPGRVYRMPSADGGGEGVVFRLETASGRELLAYRSGAETDRNAAPDRTADGGVKVREAGAGTGLEKGIAHLNRGEFEDGEQALQQARRSTGQQGLERCSIAYHLGLCLRYLGRGDEAQQLFEEAADHALWRHAALVALAEGDAASGQWERCAQRLQAALRLNADSNAARNLAVLTMRRFNRPDQANELLKEAFTLDPLNLWSLHLAGSPMTGDSQAMVDVAFHYGRAGLWAEAAAMLSGIAPTDVGGGLMQYARAYCNEEAGEEGAAGDETDAGGHVTDAGGHVTDAGAQVSDGAASVALERVIPAGSDQYVVLESAVRRNPHDAQAFFYLGNWLHAHQRTDQALECWAIAIRLNTELAAAHRNRGLVFIARGEWKPAFESYDRAVQSAGQDWHLIWERDQLWRYGGISPQQRLEAFDSFEAASSPIPTLNTERARLLIQTQRLEEAMVQVNLLHPADRASLTKQLRIQLALAAIETGAWEEAAEILASTEGSDDVLFWSGECQKALGQLEAAAAVWETAAHRRVEVLGEEGAFYRALSQGRLGDRRGARHRLRQLWFEGRRIARSNQTLMPEKPADSVLFTHGAEREAKTLGLFLQLQSRVGMNQMKLARRTANQLLAIDPYHAGLADLLRPTLLPRLVA